MRFMTLELLQDETDQGPQKWEEACELSWREFQKCRKKLPDDLVSHLENGFFHDYFIDDIHIRRRREKDRRIVFDLELKMEHMGEKGSLMHYNVQDIQLCMRSLNEYVDFGDYLYGEIYLEKKIWVHNFLLISDSEINIKCKRIEWLPEKKE